LEVETGISSDTEIELLSGVEDGSEIVCGPYKTLHKDLKDGQVVQTGQPEDGKKE